MKLRASKQRKRAFTFYEVLLVIVALLLLAMVLLPRLVKLTHHNGEVYCLMNVRDINVAFAMWSSDHDGKFPMELSVTNGGAMEAAATGNAAGCFLAMSNALGSPRILICPVDKTHVAVTNFNELNNSHVSYFIGVDASRGNAEGILTGDANLAIGGVPVRSGLLALSTNTPVAWTTARHPYGGTLGYTDGRAAECVNSELSPTLQLTQLATNRFAIP